MAKPEFFASDSTVIATHVHIDLGDTKQVFTRFVVTIDVKTEILAFVYQQK